MTTRDESIRPVEAFLKGLGTNNVEIMPLAADIVPTSPLDPDHPAAGREAVVEFLEKRVFPRVPVRKADIERHIVEGDCVATLWTATFVFEGDREVVVPIFDYFRLSGGLIREIRPYFDPQPLKEFA
jgi:predicted SnoaL-like aldol condensation-catalyzing enzyme